MSRQQRTLSVHLEHELLLKLELAGLTEEDAQSIIGSRGNKLALSLVQFARNGGLPIPANGGAVASRSLPAPSAAPGKKNPYEKERVTQAWHYPKGFAVPSVSAQIERVKLLWPGIDVSNVITLADRFSSLPAGFDGVEVKPKIAYLGRTWDMGSPYATHYGPTVEKVLAMLDTQRSGKFINYRSGEMTERYIRPQAEVLELLRQIEDNTPGDVMVTPVSLGNLYAGYSARNGRFDALSRGYLPNGAAHVGCSLLVMPERLTEYGQLFMDCPGDEWNGDAGGYWARCPCFYFFGGHLEFRARDAGIAGDYCGGVVSCPGVPELVL
jgi:hypothetical protein